MNSKIYRIVKKNIDFKQSITNSDLYWNLKILFF